MTAAQAGRRRPEGRYDAPSRVGQRSLALLLSVLFVALLVAIAAALFQRITGDRVSARVIDFQVQSDRSVRIDFEVLKPEGSAAYCIVRSRGADGAEVGRAVVEVDGRGTPDRVVRREYDLTTRARAVTGEVGRCSASPIPTTRPSP